MTMTTSTPEPIRRSDYRVPDYLIESTDLAFDLGEERTRVTARLALRRNHDGSRPLILDGKDLRLLSIACDGATLDPSDYRIDSESLTIPDIPDTVSLEIKTEIRPQENTSLEGLYKSSGNFCTQCEAEGFRKITYYLDRPDIMARFTTTVTADKTHYPVLLSNGNLVETEDLNGGRHRVRWEDPFPKPSYLFALVAGNLVALEDSFTTQSGRQVALRLFVEPGNLDRCGHAMASLNSAMAWDEKTFGREYDLDIFMIVAVADFNMGAMENKGLNIFNTKYVLADPASATDDDFEGIESVIGHEYFHNWSGNRVTCRDWFQLSLKEGLTIFRDQEFSSDMGSRAVKRIHDVARLRATQFPEDAGPTAHPVRPDSYMEINNFYTTTVYEKGGEIVRMIQTLLGREGFHKGMDLYFERHDGQAVTCDDFVAAMEDATGLDLDQFRRWYAQAGTPRLSIDSHYDSERKTYRLSLRQSCPPTPGQDTKKPFHVPVALGLLGSDGEDLPLRLASEDALTNETVRVLELRKEIQHFEFVNVPERPIASLLRNFSAPVKLSFDRTDDDLAFLMAHDSDPFNRWEAGQQYAVAVILRRLEGAKDSDEIDPQFLDAFATSLTDNSQDPGFLAETLALPSEVYLGECVEQIDVDGIHRARNFVRKSLAGVLQGSFRSLYEANWDAGANSTDAAAISRRRLKNRALDYLVALNDPESLALCVEQYDRAETMTDTIAALRLLADGDSTDRPRALSEFYDRWRDNPLVVDKWFSIQAMSRRADTLGAVTRLLDHPDFSLTNPNRFRSLVAAFSVANRVRFHEPGGAGYRFLADQVLRLDPLNPQIAARSVGVLGRWRKFDPARQELMKSELQRILESDGLSKDVFEIASKSLS